MNVIVYDEKGLRHTLTLVHEILERPDDIAITYTDLSDNTFKSQIFKKVLIARIGVTL